MSCHVMSCHVMSCHVMSCHVMSCHVMSCHVMSCHVMSCHVMPSGWMRFALGTPGTCHPREMGVGSFFGWSVQPKGTRALGHWSFLFILHACVDMVRHVFVIAQSAPQPPQPPPPLHLPSATTTHPPTRLPKNGKPRSPTLSSGGGVKHLCCAPKQTGTSLPRNAQVGTEVQPEAAV